MLKNRFLWITLLWIGIIVYLCLTPSDGIPTIDIPNLDKFVHAFLHLVLTGLCFLFLKSQAKQEDNKMALFFSSLFSIVFGIGIEIIQSSFTTTRSGDYLDVLANVSGTLLSFCFLIIYNPKRIG